MIRSIVLALGLMVAVVVLGVSSRVEGQRSPAPSPD